MIIHVTRHGQPVIGDLQPRTRHQYPPGDPVLTALGRRQATWLGDRLLEMGFGGPVFSSPYRRAMETAHLVAETAGTPLFPEPAIQEYVTSPGMPDMAGLTADQMRRLYPGCEPSDEMPYPWFVRGPEAEDEVAARIRPFLERLLASGVDEALLVGHGASVHGCISVLAPGAIPVLQADAVPFNWNCGLTSIRAAAGGSASVVRLFDVSHIPLESVTSNLQRAHPL